jgi:Bacterial membrane protein YfhO
MWLHERKRDAAALLAIAACIVAAFWKIALTNQYTFIESPDIGHQVLPWLQVQATALHKGVVPLWDPYMLGGQPLAGQVQPAVFSPLTWLLWLSPLDSSGHLQLAWLHAWFVLLHVIAGWFAYALLRDLGARREACVVGAVFFGASGFVGNTPWPQIAAGAIWLPLVFLFYMRGVRGDRPLSSRERPGGACFSLPAAERSSPPATPRHDGDGRLKPAPPPCTDSRDVVFNAALAGGFLALSLLSGHHAVPTFAALAIIGIGIAAWRTSPVPTALALAVGGLGAAVQILPAMEYARHAVRWVNAANPVTWGGVVPYPVHQMLGWNASELLFLILPGAKETIVNPLVGIVPLTLAAIALLANPRRCGAGLFAGVALGAMLFSLAGSNLFHGLLYALIPGVEKARAPIMAMAVADVAIAALAAFGVDALLADGVPNLRRVSIAVAAISAFLFVVSIYPPLILRGVPHGADRAAAIAIVAALLSLLISKWKRGFVIGLLALALIEIGNSTGFDYVHVEDKASLVRPRLYGGTSDLANFLAARIGASRMTYDYADLAFNFGEWYGIASMSGFIPSAPVALWRLGTWNSRVLDLYGVRYFVGHEPPADGGREIFQSAGGWKVWERATAFPRAWVVHRVVRALDPATNLRDTVVLDRPAPVESCTASEPVEVRTPGVNHVEMDVTLQCQGIVVLSDNWFPGWRVTIDGMPAEILTANTSMRGVPVPGGHHRIAMAYHPAGVYWGGIVSLGVFLGLGVMVLARRKNQ